MEPVGAFAVLVEGGGGGVRHQGVHLRLGLDALAAQHAHPGVLLQPRVCLVDQGAAMQQPHVMSCNNSNNPKAAMQLRPVWSWLPWFCGAIAAVLSALARFRCAQDMMLTNARCMGFLWLCACGGAVADQEQTILWGVGFSRDSDITNFLKSPIHVLVLGQSFS